MSLAKLFKSSGEDPDRNETETQSGLISKAVNTYEIALGYDHPETGEGYAKMGLCCQEAGNFDGA